MGSSVIIPKKDIANIYSSRQSSSVAEEVIEDEGKESKVKSCNFVKGASTGSLTTAQIQKLHNFRAQEKIRKSQRNSSKEGEERNDLPTEENEVKEGRIKLNLKVEAEMTTSNRLNEGYISEVEEEEDDDENISPLV